MSVGARSQGHPAWTQPREAPVRAGAVPLHRQRWQRAQHRLSELSGMGRALPW